MTVFESMSRFDVVCAWILALAGRKVRYIKKPRRDARPLLAVFFRQKFFYNRVKPFRFIWNKDYFDGMWGDRAFSTVDDVYGKLSESGFAGNLPARFGLAGELTVKKILTTQLSRFYYLNEVMGYLDGKFCSKIVFVPASGIFYGYYTSSAQEVLYYDFLFNIVLSAGVSLERHERVSFSKLVHIRGTVFLYLELAARHVRMAGRIIKYFFIALKNTLSFKARKSWRYGLMIMSLDRQFHNDAEGLDFLIDGVRIKKDEMVFIPHSFIKLGNRQRAYIRRKKLEYINNVYDYYLFSGWAEMFYSYIRTMFIAKLFLLKAVHELCVETALWRSFSSCVHLDNVIGHHDVSVSALCRNIILEKQQGTRSWLYLDSNNWTSFFAPDGRQTDYKTNFYSFMRYNYAVCWNKKAEEILLASHNKIDFYYPLGSLWSTFIKRHKNDAMRNKKRGGMCTIVAFDSSYTNYSVSNSRCAYFFYKGLLRLLNEMSDVAVLMKPKKSRKYHEAANEDRSMFRVLDMLERHSRYCAVDYTQPRGEIIAQADLVIAYPFTSAAFEAVCAGVPAIYYDATGAFPNSIYQDCGIVASGYNDLAAKVKKYLNMPKAEFYEWQLKNRSVFGGYMDGHGLDRFVEKLTDLYEQERFNMIRTKKECFLSGLS